MRGIDANYFYFDHPVEFAVDLIGVRPDAAQARVMESVARSPFTSVRSGHGVGKSAVEAWLILWYMFTRPHCKIPCTAPTQHQLQDILWSEIAKWLQSSRALSPMFVWTRERLYFKNHPETWFAVARTATNPDALQGFHADNVFFVIDEASGVSDKVFEPVLGAMTTQGVRLLMCGNPTRLTGFFHDSHTRNRALYDTHHVDGRASRRVSDVFVRQIIAMYGEDSDVFRVRVAGEFPRAQSDSFIAMEWAEKASEGNGPPPLTASRVDIGIDVARFGDDSSALVALLDRRYELPPEIYHHNDTMQLTGHAVALIRRMAADYPAASIHVKVDCDGLGVGVYDRLNEQRAAILQGRPDAPELLECHFGGAGGKPSGADPVEYANSTGIMWGCVREALRTGVLTLHNDANQIAQLSGRRYAINSKGEIELERKESMKKRGLPSPDIADALALALWSPKRSTYDMEFA